MLALVPDLPKDQREDPPRDPSTPRRGVWVADPYVLLVRELHRQYKLTPLQIARHVRASERQVYRWLGGRPPRTRVYREMIRRVHTACASGKGPTGERVIEPCAAAGG